MNQTSHVQTLVNEVESTSDLVDELLRQLRTLALEHPAVMKSVAPAMHALETRAQCSQAPRMLLKVYREVSDALDRLRVSRDTIEEHAINRLRDTTSKLGEVTSATETAASTMLDSLDRTLAVIDRLDEMENGASPAPTNTGGPAALKQASEALRNEVNNLFQCLQFQDITSQQIGGATQGLAEVEQRLQSLVDLFQGGARPQTHLADTTVTGSTHDLSYNPDATTQDAHGRQSVADDVMAATSGHRRDR